MRILVTGSGGMLGHKLCDVLSKNGMEVSGMDIADIGSLYKGSGRFYMSDITIPEDVMGVFEKERPGLVIHTAAWTDVDGCEKDPEKARLINVVGTSNIVEAASKYSAGIIYISTDFVFSGTKRSPYTELDECDPRGVYAKTKFEGEKIVGKFPGDKAIVRTSWLFGEGGKNFVEAIITKARENEVLEVVDDQKGSPTYTGDLAMAVRALITYGVKGSEVYHVCNSGECTWYDFACRIRDLVPEMNGKKIEPVSSKHLGRPAPRPAFSVMETSKFRKHTRMNLRHWQEALSEYLGQRGKG